MLSKISNITSLCFIQGFFLLFYPEIKAQTTFDSIKPKAPKHFFNTVVFYDSYTKPKQALNDTVDYLNERLGSYAVKQRVLAFYMPLYTAKEFNRDSSIYSNTHYLLTGQMVLLQPKFDGITTHNLIKAGVGLRMIHNTGKKGLWFIDISPFYTTDVTFGNDNGYFRMSNSFIYSHNFSEKFNLRVGLTKSFLWGNRNYLPYLGFRIGKLDKFHFSLQIPKNMSFNIPLSNKFRLSLYTKPQGGMYTFSNKDSVYYFNRDANYFFLTRYELLSGLRFDAAFGNNFSFYVALGTSSRNKLTFYSEKANADRPNLPYKTYFFERSLKPTGFFNFGLVLRLGKTKNIYGNRNLYDAIDINNSIGVGDNNIAPGLHQIPVEESVKRSKLNLADIQDLIDANEF